jgi:hypothetical protein
MFSCDLCRFQAARSCRSEPPEVGGYNASAQLRAPIQVLIRLPGLGVSTSSNANGQNQSTFSFQAHSAAVPEQSTVELLAIGAVGALGWHYCFRRKFKAA